MPGRRRVEMTAYWDEKRCKSCSEPLEIAEERDRGCHEACDPIDKVSGARLPYRQPDNKVETIERHTLQGVVGFE